MKNFYSNQALKTIAGSIHKLTFYTLHPDLDKYDDDTE